MGTILAYTLYPGLETHHTIEVWQSRPRTVSIHTLKTIGQDGKHFEGHRQPTTFTQANTMIKVTRDGQMQEINHTLRTLREKNLEIIISSWIPSWDTGDEEAKIFVTAHRRYNV